jgi:O-antigen/teichoic acid export membrane protein
MNSLRSVVKINSIVSFSSQILSIVFQFVCRTVFIKYLGMTYMGLNDTFNSVFSTLSLAEMGFQTAILYHLYEPFNKNDRETIDEIVAICHAFYIFIGAFFLVATMVTTPLIKYILNGIEIDSWTYIYYILMGLNISISYFLAYKRILLYADRKVYICKAVDSCCVIVFSALKIAILYFTSSFMLYLMICIFQTIISNVIILFYCDNTYSFIVKRPVNHKILSEIFKDIKNLFVGKIAGYVYSSTDSLVISILINTLTVGIYSNYTLIINGIRTLADSILEPLSPIIGRRLNQNTNSDSNLNLLYFYTFSRFVIALFSTVPILVLVQDFIDIWIGKSHQLNITIVILLVTNVYIHLVHSALCDFIFGIGLFKQDKIVSLIGAACNIVSSIVLARTIGLVGVVLGTTISELVFWVLRAISVFFYGFKDNKNSNIIKYIYNNIMYLFTEAVCYLMTHYLYSLLHISNLIIKLIIGGIICEGTTLFIVYIIYRKSENYILLKELLFSNGRLKKSGDS